MSLSHPRPRRRYSHLRRPQIPAGFFLSFRPDVSVTLCPTLHDLTPSSQKLFEVSGSLTFLVSSKRRTRYNFLLILSSPCSPEESSVTCGQRQRVAEQRQRCSGGNKMQGEGQEVGPVTAPNQASLPRLSLSACSLDSQNFPDSVIVKVHRKLIRV